jgi:hypothetical protein
MSTIFIDAFKRGLLDAHPDETLDEARERFIRESEALDFDTPNEVSPMATELPSPDLDALAIRWRCSSRTVRRMHAAGVDTEDPVDVGAYLAAVRAPSEEMITAVLDELQAD